MQHEMNVLNGSGHLKIVWDPSKPEEVEHARAEVARLKAEGYEFFTVVEPDANPMVSSFWERGELIVEKRIDDPVAPTIVALPDPKPASRRGRRPAAPQATTTVAVPRLRGG